MPTLCLSRPSPSWLPCGIIKTGELSAIKVRSRGRPGLEIMGRANQGGSNRTGNVLLHEEFGIIQLETRSSRDVRRRIQHGTEVGFPRPGRPHPLPSSKVLVQSNVSSWDNEALMPMIPEMRGEYAQRFWIRRIIFARAQPSHFPAVQHTPPHI